MAQLTIVYDPNHETNFHPDAAKGLYERGVRWAQLSVADDSDLKEIAEKLASMLLKEIRP